MRTLLPILDEWSADGRRAALCTVVAIHDHAPLPLGSSLIVAEDGRCAGGVSGGCVEREVTEVAQAVLRGAPPRRLRFAPGADELTGAPLPCGGGIDVWVQAWDPEQAAQGAFAEAVRASEAARLPFTVGPAEVQAAIEPTAGVGSGGGTFTLEVPRIAQLVLVGAGPVAGALCALAPTLGMRAIVVDPRTTVAAHAPIAAASELLLCWPEAALARLGPLGDDDAVIALSHQPAIDDIALRAALASGAGFVGALGARRTHAARLERLRERGVGELALARIVGPVGLDLGGWTPGEVALSIAAELVAARHGRAGGRLHAGSGPIHGDIADPHVLDPLAGDPAMLGTTGLPSGGGARVLAEELTAPVSAVVLAAGAGRRFGGAKQAAEWDGEALVARAVRAAAGALPEGSEIIVVLGAHEAIVRAALPDDVPHRVVVAADWADGLGASLRAGLDAAGGSHALVLLADQPLVDAPLVARVLREGCPALANGAAAARPVVDGRPGHPVLLGPIARTRVDDLGGDRGLAPLLESLHVHEIAVRERGAIIDVDQPADLLRAAPPTRPATRLDRLAGTPHATGGAPRPGAPARATRTPPWT